MLKKTCALFVIAVFCGALGGCDDTEEVIDCVDLCDELDGCFADGFDATDCIDECEEQSEAAIDVCDGCLDANERECTACDAECEMFIDVATNSSAVPPPAL